MAWQVSERGNKFFERADWRVTVFPDGNGSETLWKFCAAYDDEDDPFFSDHYFTEADAMADALRFHRHQPLLNNTYQAQRDTRRREELPQQIDWQRTKLTELLAKIERAKLAKTLTSKRVQNLLSEADKRASQSLRLLESAGDLKAPPDIFEQCRALAEEHRSAFAGIKDLAAKTEPEKS